MRVTDCHYKSGATSVELIETISNHLIHKKPNTQSFENMKTNEVLKFFRGLFAHNIIEKDNKLLFKLFIDLTHDRIEDFNLSMVLTTLEICRNCDPLSE